ncbi:MAG TPA: hypothetical protein VKT50_10325, partial [Candidatus Acidoferrales bacterium]|nr:hypothetical protein [Candidatus Acidoferrales bacterium]
MAITVRKKINVAKVARPTAAKSRWRLRKSDGLQILQAEPFNQFKWLVHGFSTRPGGVSELKNSRLGRSKKEAVLNLG